MIVIRIADPRRKGRTSGSNDARNTLAAPVTVFAKIRLATSVKLLRRVVQYVDAMRAPSGVTTSMSP